MSERWRNQVLMVIPSVEGEALLARMLPTVRHTPANVVVLDQGSRDGTAALCARLGVGLIQLGRRHTYTEAGNIGAGLARERGFPFLCLANNDITFRTDVLAQLHAAMLDDPALGIVAPSQLATDPGSGARILSNRVWWDLDHVAFQHDAGPVEPGVLRLEADFCELTCALVRMAAVEEVGFLDDEYGFYHEDADFGFRLRRAGWGCAYLPQTQIVHFTSSTFANEASGRKRDYIARNRRLFVSRHLGYGVRLPPPAPGPDGVAATLRRYGLVHPAARALVSAPPGTETDGYLAVPLATDHVPARWGRFADRTRAVFTRTDAQRDGFRALGFPQAHTVPAGIEPDVFHPWGARLRPAGDATTFLAWCDGWAPGALAPVLDAWRRFARGRDVRLVLYGRGLDGVPGQAADTEFETHRGRVSLHHAERLTVFDLHSAMPDEEAAPFFRGIDYVVNRPGSEAAAWAALQAAACGALALDDLPGGFGVADALFARLEATRGLHGPARTALVSASVNRVRATATLRHTAMGLHHALSLLQIREPGAVLARLDLHEQQRVAVLATAAPQPQPDMGRLGGMAARRIMTLGRLTSEFGTAWQRRGLLAAGSAVGTELRHFATYRAGRLLGRAPPPPVPATSPTPPPGLAAATRSVLLVGYIDAQLGLGQSLRGLARALAAAPVEFRICPVGLGVEGRRGAPFMPERDDLAGVHAVNVLELTPDELPRVLDHIGAYRAASSYNILRTYWELGRAPEAWRAKLAGMHEIWAPNPFVAESLRGVFDGAITVVPPCLDVPEPVPGGHEAFGLERETFWFLFSFDYFSFPQRKNPLAVVRAFRAAFPRHATRAGLVLKAAGAAGHHPEVKAALREAAAADGRIVVLDEALTRAEMLSLLTACDAYVSLHRAEGFGLGMAEAMALGKPVVATAYSGNADFITAETAYPVPFTLRPVAPGEYVHAENQVWAEPDEDAAAALMRRVFEDGAERERVARAGQGFVLERYGAANVGRVAGGRLRELLGVSAAGAAPRAAAVAGPGCSAQGSSPC